MSWDMLRAVLKSTADTAIFPVQDLLDLPAGSRMNKPGTVERNWEWRLSAPLDGALAAEVKGLAEEAGRTGGTRG
jgi:4-alpha-glucanotransferase